jgi:hypothetical protein
MNRFSPNTGGDSRMTRLQPGRSVPPRGLQIDPVPDPARRERRTWTAAQRALLVVVAGLVSLLLAAWAIALIPCVEQARLARARHDLANLRRDAAAFETSAGRLPASLAELGFEQQLTDPWGHPYRYWILAGHPVFLSLGPDGHCGANDLTSEDFPLDPAECEARDR